MLFRQFAPGHELSRGRAMLPSCRMVVVTRNRVPLAVVGSVHIQTVRTEGTWSQTVLITLLM